MSHPNGPRTGRPPTYGTRGMVATSHVLASSSGERMLRRGGSAVDAVISANAVLCVVYPHMAGLGGDSFMLIHDPAKGGVQALNASGPAAKLATRDYYRQRGHEDVIPARGGLAALTVPGAVDGWREAHERHGKLPWAELFEDAIHYARNGFPVSRSLSDWSHTDVPVLSQFPLSVETFLPGGKPPKDGDRLAFPRLAETFERLAKDGPRAGFYEGETARVMCDALAAMDSPLRAEDLADYRAEWVDPISTDYRGYTAYEFPPNTQGFAALQILNIIEGYDVKSWGDNTADFYHFMAEATKLALADRNEWLTDPKHQSIPLDKLLCKDYAAERRAMIDPLKAAVMGEVPAGIAYDGATASQGAEGDTCYFCAVDGDGLAVSIIESVYHDFGSGVIAGETGILMQNRGSFFSLDDKHVNRLEPGKRTFHTLIPAMLFKDGSPYLVYGSMGGEGQPQTHAALVSRIVDFGYDVQQAIESPRWLMGRTWGTSVSDLSIEARVGAQVARELLHRGQPVKIQFDYNDNLGHAQAIRINRETGFLEGGADPRGDGAAIGS
ncbi:gamma-glutamyltransferase [Rhodovibrionaceae bacterium A322]